MSTGQRENLDAILRQSAFPFDSDVSEQRRLLAELASAQPLPAGVTVTAAALGGVPAAEITVDGIEPRHVVLYFHGGVYVSCHRRRAGHPRHHPRGCRTSSRPTTRSSTKRPRRWTEPGSSCRRIWPAQHASPPSGS